jgi:hypothetical protein
LPSMIYFQIIIDSTFFVVIMLLLHQMNKRIAKKPRGDGATIEEFKRLVVDSQNSADQFLRAIREGEERLNNIARQLDNREKRMVLLIETAESLIQKMTSRQRALAETGKSDGDKYGQIIRMFQKGLSREEIASRFGVAVGEIDLVVELEQTKADNS